MELKNKKVSVVGLGNSGLNAAIFLSGLGADVRATDSQDTPSTRKSRDILKVRNVKVEIGGHTENFISGSELVVVSPGVENSSNAMKWAAGFGIPVISEMELAFRYCKGRIIAITGTNGKSTVAILTGDILRNGGKDAVVCGNIGNSLCGEMARIDKDTWVVLEVSSFQLERTELFRPHIALILNITDDHMDRYSAFEDYFKEKLKIFRNQTKEDILILNRDAANLRPLEDMARSKTLFYSRFSKTNGAYLKDGGIFCAAQNAAAGRICSPGDIALKGTHNLENVLASCLAGCLAGVNAVSICDAIRTFRGLPHRFETVDIIDGVEYIDDSKGTTVDSTVRALESCTKSVILIAGGKDKNSDYAAAADMIKRKAKHLILIGEAAGRIGRSLGDIVETHEAGDMDEAVELSERLASRGDCVLLSPMCSSFDMFENYKARGEAFKRSVMRLKGRSRKIGTAA